jgi:hypothetical protein
MAARTKKKVQKRSEIVRMNMAMDQDVVDRWRARLDKIVALYRAHDGRLWGLPRLGAKESPQQFVTIEENTGTRGLAYLYPQGWTQLEDENRDCEWLRLMPQRLVTYEFLEQEHVEPVIPKAPGDWTRLYHQVASRKAGR